MTYDEELDELADIMKNYLKHLKTLSKDKRKVLSLKNLQDAGIVDELGKKTKHYKN